MKIILSLLLIICSSYCVIKSAEQVNLEQVNLEQVNTEQAKAAKLLNSYLQKLDSYEANFQQQNVSNSRRIIDTVSGRFILKRPNHFRWQIISPYEQTIIADGQSLWSIDNDLEQVIVANLEENIVNSPIMLLSKKDSQLEKIFSVHLVPSENDLERFLLLPLDNSSNFEQVQIGFKDGILQMLELHDSLGQITLVTMTNVRNNPIVGAHHFIYEAIEGFDVIDSRTQEEKGD